MNGIVFLVSLSESSLLVYNNAVDSWLFILHPAAFLSSFTRSRRFLVESLAFSVFSARVPFH